MRDFEPGIGLHFRHRIRIALLAEEPSTLNVACSVECANQTSNANIGFPAFQVEGQSS
jgi:hypothetical protein